MRKHYYEKTEQSLYKARKISNKEKYQPVCVKCKNEDDRAYDRKRYDSKDEVTIAKNLVFIEDLKLIKPDRIKSCIGIPDILTESQIIEVKHGKNWKHAIGQLLVYKLYYPEHLARIHLFGGNLTTIDRKMVEEHCDKFNIKVSWDC